MMLLEGKPLSPPTAVSYRLSELGGRLQLWQCTRMTRPNPTLSGARPGSVTQLPPGQRLPQEVTALAWSFGQRTLGAPAARQMRSG